MPFTDKLNNMFDDRHGQFGDEFGLGESLETVLRWHLLAIEASADAEMLTSILLVDESGSRLLHGAAPSLPKTYCAAIDGGEIGPKAGPCGTAAYTGKAIYVTDIAADPQWDDYRHLLLPYGLRSCWATPIRDAGGEIIGTFTIYHLTPRSATADEVEAIRLITSHVAQAIMRSRNGASDRQITENEVQRQNMGAD